MLLLETIAVRAVHLAAYVFPCIRKQYHAHLVRLNGKWTIDQIGILVVDLQLDVDLKDRMITGKAIIYDVTNGLSRDVSVLGTTLLQSTYITLYEQPNGLNEGISYVLLKKKDKKLQWCLLHTEQPDLYPHQALLSKMQCGFLFTAELDFIEALPAYAMCTI